MEFETKHELLQWLSELGKCTILAFSLMSSGANLHSNMPMTPEQMGYTLNRQELDVGEGPYRVRVSTQANDDQLNIQLSLQNKMVLFWGDMRYASSGEPMGGYPELLEELSGFDYVSRETRKGRVSTGCFIVPIPSDPVLLSILQRVAATHAITWIVEDGSGYIHPGNTFFGNGSQPSSWRKA
ncbi:hypothetical protein BXT89_14440 [Halopseudomonas pachastrellae]|uniref:Uncharacterized protein n=1 Tax=Halopseudomonas pachastrellae TaxID=254161 RepID=A0A1S8DFF3_9GAMM|nr:hypothetical protein [Halopseudomonas pachastrellae]ONM43147.1 hypothetical protein BXT89_14440 [Halopseudomonas pachastrellae]SFL71603.1 hypothetical protein SAMN05216256_101110 [Halopseudomonas pachastrellae]